ncbi:DUF1631 domain-containing protein [Pseudomonas xionganensis]|uniref:DUF1631 family protein n=1 Tax=Pseudomonas xionganensis TaxID=2654845 RepID=A0A6I4KRB9_9PSED|nr:DUF1631 domain-containing protein [Pseudomonas xionganensis]MVW74905.1 DUF1631 family protein [Pseudomonas xionganensis]
MSTQGTPPDTPHKLANRIIQPRHGELVQRCRQLVMNKLAEQLGRVFGQVDDSLFECAEKAENNQLQNLFFDNMREIRKQRPQIERSYHQKISHNLNAFLEGRLQPAPHAAPLDAEQMALVQNEDYEESLQIIHMVSRVKARCAQTLFTLEQRLALLNNGQKLSEDSNPFGPQVIAQAFRDSLAPMPFPLRIRIILYGLFDRYVMQGLDALYIELNQQLIDAGILPNLKYRVQASTSPARPARSDSPAEPAERPAVTQPHAPAPELNGPPPSDPAQLLGSLAALLSERRQSAPDSPLPGNSRSMASFNPSGATHSYSASELLDALDRLQQQAAQELAQHLQHPQQVESLKANLQAQLEAHSARPGQQKLSEQETDVIDLVGMLFDFILDDENLPDSCKTILSHLHTPYLKVALQDKALFTQHHHPARRLLNAMAQAGVLYGGEGDERGLLGKMHWVVERIIHAFSGDLQLFDSLLQEFDDFVATLRHKVELRERRAVEAAKGRDKLLGARQRATEVISQCLEGRHPPSIIRNFLELTWTDVLVFVLLRQGEQHPQWQRACEVAEQLAWSGTALDSAGQKRLQGLRVALLEDLRKGLQLLGGYHEDGIRRLLQDLVACQHAVQAQQPQLAAKLTPTLADSPLGAMLGEDAHLLRPNQSPALSARARQLREALTRIEFGTWFEFIENNQPRQLKLSWFSPTTHNYMFVDHGGQRAAVKALNQLAQELEQGQARILTEERNTPLVDRALHAIYRVLQRFTGRSPESHKEAP